MTMEELEKENAALKLEVAELKAKLHIPRHKGSGRFPAKPVDEYLKELEELEAIKKPTKAQTNRKCQIRFQIRKKAKKEGRQVPEFKIMTWTRPAPEPAKTNWDAHKVLVYLAGTWQVKKICGTRDEAVKELTRLTYEGFQTKIARV